MTSGEGNGGKPFSGSYPSPAILQQGRTDEPSTPSPPAPEKPIFRLQPFDLVHEIENHFDPLEVDAALAVQVINSTKETKRSFIKVVRTLVSQDRLDQAVLVVNQDRVARHIRQSCRCIDRVNGVRVGLE